MSSDQKLFPRPKLSPFDPMYSRPYNSGYTRGGLDVVTAINLLFKGILLFPVFMLAVFIGVAMLKHFIFNGVPTMNKPTPQQQERLRLKDAQIGEPVYQRVSQRVSLPPEKPVVLPEPPVKPSSPILEVSNQEEVFTSSQCLSELNSLSGIKDSKAYQLVKSNCESLGA